MKRTNSEQVNELEEPSRDNLLELRITIILPCQIIKSSSDRMSRQSSRPDELSLAIEHYKPHELTWRPSIQARRGKLACVAECCLAHHTTHPEQMTGWKGHNRSTQLTFPVVRPRKYIIGIAPAVMPVGRSSGWAYMLQVRVKYVNGMSASSMQMSLPARNSR